MLVSQKSVWSSYASDLDDRIKELSAEGWRVIPSTRIVSAEFACIGMEKVEYDAQQKKVGDGISVKKKRYGRIYKGG